MPLPHVPIPVMFVPLLKPRPWGGRRLESLFGKSLPAGELVGESWELVSLDAEDSRVRAGPLAGAKLSDLLAAWGAQLLGSAAADSAHFPLLIKLLDACENLSVQVHPKPGASASSSASARDVTARIKHEAWYVTHADPGAKIWVGANPGVTLADFQRAAGTPAIVGLLRERTVRAGDCFYLPSGIPHALGAGVVVAEVQTPSDTTYRLYDWERLGLDGRPRALHLDQALTNLRVDVDESEIVQPREHVAGGLVTLTHLCRCERFMIDRVRLSEGFAQRVPALELAVWIILAGRVRLTRGAVVSDASVGDVVLIPADSADVSAAVLEDCDLLQVTIPAPSPLGAHARPAPEARQSDSGRTQLTRDGKPITAD